MAASPDDDAFRAFFRELTVASADSSSSPATSASSRTIAARRAFERLSEPPVILAEVSDDDALQLVAELRARFGHGGDSSAAAPEPILIPGLPAPSAKVRVTDEQRRAVGQDFVLNADLLARLRSDARIRDLGSIVLLDYVPVLMSLGQEELSRALFRVRAEVAEEDAARELELVPSVVVVDGQGQGDGGGEGADEEDEDEDEDEFGADEESDEEDSYDDEEEVAPVVFEWDELTRRLRSVVREWQLDVLQAESGVQLVQRLANAVQAIQDSEHFAQALLPLARAQASFVVRDLVMGNPRQTRGVLEAWKATVLRLDVAGDYDPDDLPTCLFVSVLQTLIESGAAVEQVANLVGPQLEWYCRGLVAMKGDGKAELYHRQALLTVLLFACEHSAVAPATLLRTGVVRVVSTYEAHTALSMRLLLVAAARAPEVQAYVARVKRFREFAGSDAFRSSSPALAALASAVLADGGDGGAADTSALVARLHEQLRLGEVEGWLPHDEEEPSDAAVREWHSSESPRTALQLLLELARTLRACGPELVQRCGDLGEELGLLQASLGRAVPALRQEEDVPASVVAELLLLKGLVKEAGGLASGGKKD